MHYLFDTDICIYIAKKKPPSLLNRFKQLQTGDAAMSIVTYMELLDGADKSDRREANLSTVQELTSLIPVLSLDAPAADHFGRLRSELERKGTPIGAYDLIIA